MELSFIDYLSLWIFLAGVFGSLLKIVMWINKATIKSQAKKLALDTGVLDVFVRQPTGAIQCVYSSGKFQERVYSDKEFASLFQNSNG